MRFVLFIEGQTEEALPGFLKGWLDRRLPSRARVGIKTICFKGLPKYYTGIKTKVDLIFASSQGKDIIAAIGLLDLYGPTFYPSGMTGPVELTIGPRNIWSNEWATQNSGNTLRSMKPKPGC